MAPSALHQRICGQAEDKLRVSDYIRRDITPVRGFIPDVLMHKGGHEGPTHIALVEVEAQSEELWGPHTERQLRRLADYTGQRDGIEKMAVLAVPSSLRSEAIALKRGLGFTDLVVWDFPDT